MEEEDIVCQTVKERRRRRRSGAEEGSPSVKNLYDNSSPHRVSNDDRSSAASGVDVADRLTYLEQRMQMQEDEIQLLKMALADVLKRLNISEEHQAANTKKGPAGKAARPVSLALPSRPSMNSPASLKKSYTTSTLPSTSTARNYSPLPPASAKSGVKSPVGSVKESPCISKTARPGPRPGPPGSTAPGSKKAESKTKEPAASVGSRQVTHCKDLSEPHNKKDWVF